MKSSKWNIEQEITDRIIKLLETKGLNWVKGWACGFPKNAITKQEYKGINSLLLNYVVEEKGWKTPYFMSFKQVKDKGGKVKKGEKGNFVVYFKILEKNHRVVDVVDSQGNKTKKQVCDKIPLLRYYYVFNVEQTTLKLEDYQDKKGDVKPIEVCEQVLTNFAGKPLIKFGGNRAFYSPKDDYIQLPIRDNFKSSEGYYSTLFHELSHSTGHKKRLDREFTQAIDGYSKEEVIAELSASFLCGYCGIENEIIANNTAYIQHFINSLKQDKKFIFSVVKDSQKAFNFILGR